MHRRTSLLVLGLVLATARAKAADPVTPGEVTTPYPTLENVSIEWAITGDDNANATVAVHYKKAGASSSSEALPLMRIPAGSGEGFDWTNKLAGSIFGLEPDTTYEVELELTDPDGGDASQTVMVTTRAVPEIATDAREVPVTPDTIGDALDAAEPGDVLVLADGTYDELVVPNDGADGMPIVLRAANPSGAIVEGDVRLDDRFNVWAMDLVVHGKFKFNDAESIVVTGCTILADEDGIESFGNGVTNAVITHNTITGHTVWAEPSLGVDGANIGEGVQLTGPGNVVAYNTVSGFRDCLSLMEDYEAVNQVSDDFYGNDLSACADDAIEADFAMGNVRVYRNRIRDSFMGLSSQPGLGGPTYFVRNVMYNVLFQAFKLQRSSVGDVGLHNTVVKSGDAFSVNTDDIFSRAWFRNNLFIGGPGGTYLDYDSGPGDVMQLPSADTSCSFDYDGYGSIGANAFSGRVGDVRFDGLSEMQSMTTEVHGVELDLSTFAANVMFPADPFAAPATPSLLLADGGAAVDKGIVLPNVNDGFSGDAPDLGAFELGADEPTYGADGSSPMGGSGGSGGAAAGEGGNGATGGSMSQGGTAQGGTQSGSSGSGGNAQGGTQGGSSQGGSNQGGSNSGTTGSGGSGATGTGGSSGTSSGGSTGSGASAGTTAAGGDSDDDSGCGCRVPRQPSSDVGALGLALLGLVTASRRRARARRTTSPG